MRRPIALLAVVAFLVFLSVPGIGSAMRFADVVVANSPVSDDGTFPDNVLGAPDGILVDFEEVDASTPGFVTVRFLGSPILDAPGDDIFIHLRDWAASDNEIFNLLGSTDGASFSVIASSGPPTGDAFAPITLGFDMADGGFGSLSFLTIENGRIDPLDNEGPDIDAIGAVPEPATAVLVLAGMLILSLKRHDSPSAR